MRERKVRDQRRSVHGCLLPLFDVPQGPWFRLSAALSRLGERLRLGSRQRFCCRLYFVPGSASNVLPQLRLAFSDQYPEIFNLQLGTLDVDPGIRPEAHWHVASMAPWCSIAEVMSTAVTDSYLTGQLRNPCFGRSRAGRTSLKSLRRLLRNSHIGREF